MASLPLLVEPRAVAAPLSPWGRGLGGGRCVITPGQTVVKRSLLGAAAEQPVVFRMGTDPKPGDAVLVVDSDGAVVQANASRPQCTNVLEVDGWMARVRLQHREAAVRQMPNLFRQGTVMQPKLRRGVVVHRRVLFPSARA